MANHVSNIITLEHGSEECFARFKELTADKFDPTEGQLWQTWMLEDDWNSTDHEKYVGPKWAVVEDFDECTVIAISAWAIPYNYMLKLSRELSKVDDEMILSIEYIDECYQFIGVNVYHSDGLVEEADLDWDDIEYSIVKSEKLPVDAKTGELTELGKEQLDDIMYDWVSDWNVETKEKMIENIVNG